MSFSKTLIAAQAFLLCFTLICPWSALGIDFISVETPDSQLVHRVENECVPTSMFYMFKLGPEPMQDIYKTLPGETDDDKLNAILDRGLDTASDLSGRPLFDPEVGVNRQDFQQWIELMQENTPVSDWPFTTQLLSRLPGEKTPGVFLNRIHRELSGSLQRGVPVMLGVSFDYTDHTEKDFFSIKSHAIVVVGIQKNLRDQEYGFAIEYIDPFSGHTFSAYIHEEMNQNFKAQIFSSLEDSENWTISDDSHSVINRFGQAISSPYLILTGPSIFPDLALNWDHTRNLLVDTMVGLSPTSEAPQP